MYDLLQSVIILSMIVNGACSSWCQQNFGTLWGNICLPSLMSSEIGVMLCSVTSVCEMNPLVHHSAFCTLPVIACRSCDVTLCVHHLLCTDNQQCQKCTVSEGGWVRQMNKTVFRHESMKPIVWYVGFIYMYSLNTDELERRIKEMLVRKYNFVHLMILIGCCYVICTICKTVTLNCI